VGRGQAYQIDHTGRQWQRGNIYLTLCCRFSWRSGPYRSRSCHYDHYHQLTRNDPWCAYDRCFNGGWELWGQVAWCCAQALLSIQRPPEGCRTWDQRGIINVACIKPYLSTDSKYGGPSSNSRWPVIVMRVRSSAYSMQLLICEMWGLHGGIVEAFTLLGYYIAYVCNLPMFQHCRAGKKFCM